jgi:hypothetical protein
MDVADERLDQFIRRLVHRLRHDNERSGIATYLADTVESVYGEITQLESASEGTDG